MMPMKFMKKIPEEMRAQKEKFDHFLLGTVPLEAWVKAERGEPEAALERLLHGGSAAAGLHGRADIQIVFWRCIAGENVSRMPWPFFVSSHDRAHPRICAKASERGRFDDDTLVTQG